MRSLPEDDSDRKDIVRLNAEPWMVDCLKLNPDYTCWGPGEDSMSTEGQGWSSSVVVPTWEAFGPWSLDDLNECVNFYFEVNRATAKCDACDGSGYNPATKQISGDFYDFAGTGRRRCDKITQDEVDALIEAGRLTDLAGRTWDPKAKALLHPEPRRVVTAEMVNAQNRPGARGFGHDAINASILIRTRATRLGVYGDCPSCVGHGYVFTEPAGKLGITLWFLHPRKGCSRGVRVEHITHEQLPIVLAYLEEAGHRNASRFAKARAENRRDKTEAWEIVVAGAVVGRGKTCSDAWEDAMQHGRPLASAKARTVKVE